MLLKALFPALDWSTPQTVITNLLPPGIDLPVLLNQAMTVQETIRQGVNELEMMRIQIAEMRLEMWRIHGRTDSNSTPRIGPGITAGANNGAGTGPDHDYQQFDTAGAD